MATEESRFRQQQTNCHRQHLLAPQAPCPYVRQTGGPSIKNITNNFNSNGAHGGALRPATESQLRALRAICKRSQFDLEMEAHDEFGLIAAQLDVRQASQLIDLLKNRQTESPAGRGRFRS